MLYGLRGLLVVSSLLAPGAAQAQEAYRLTWSFPEISAAEYAVLLSLPLVYLTFDDAVPQPTEARWSGGNAFDTPLQSALGDSSETTRRTLGDLGTITWYLVRAYPVADAIVVSLADDWNWALAWRMTALNLGAMTLQALVKMILVRTTARHRPSTDLCLEDGGTPDSCRADNTKSFPSGHTMSAFTGAGLACAHHGAMPLYRDEIADATACIVSLGLATTTAVTRVTADKHYVSDVLVGTALGLSIGWLLPYLLHYQHDGAHEGSAGPSFALAPLGDFETSFGVSAVADW